MDTGEAVKKYWPWVLGGVAGLYVLSRMGGSSAPPDNGMSAYAAMMQAQMAAGQQNAQISAQREAIQAQQAGQAAQIKSQYDIALMQREVALANTNAAIAKSDNETSVGFILANAQLASGAGSAASGIIAALGMPAVAAVNAMSNENSAALKSAGAVSAAAFMAQMGMVNKAVESTARIGPGLAVSPWGSNPVTMSSNQAGAQSVSSGAYSTGQTTGAISDANARGTESTWGAAGSMFGSLMGAFT